MVVSYEGCCWLLNGNRCDMRYCCMMLFDVYVNHISAFHFMMIVLISLIYRCNDAGDSQWSQDETAESAVCSCVQKQYSTDQECFVLAFAIY